MELRDDMTPFEAVNFFFHKAAEIDHLSDAAVAVLTGTYRELRVQVPVRRDDGSLDVFHGYRIQHNGARGPYKGGTRYHPTANLDEVRALASLIRGSMGEGRMSGWLRRWWPAIAAHVAVIALWHVAAGGSSKTVSLQHASGSSRAPARRPLSECAVSSSRRPCLRVRTETIFRKRRSSPPRSLCAHER